MAATSAAAATDSFELQLEELWAADVGSNFKDNLKDNSMVENFLRESFSGIYLY